jgi:hypothetical protein
VHAPQIIALLRRPPNDRRPSHGPQG